MTARPVPAVRTTGPTAGMRVAVIGAGFGGIAAAVALKRAGFADLVVYEKSSGIGGTWFDNRYPGAATDAASHIYSYSFAPHDWDRTHVGHEALRAYLERVADDFGLHPHLRLDTGVVSAVWDDARSAYRVELTDGSKDIVDAVVSATGMFAKPRQPVWPGRELFAGEVVHSARWGDADLSGKRVAVVGTGSSAAQIVPALAGTASRILVFQRQPGWLLPKKDRNFRPEERRRLRNPLLRRLYRLKLYVDQELREWNGAFFRPGSRANSAARTAALAYIDTVFAGRDDLKRAVTPDYPMAGKRTVVSSDFFPALLRDDVALVPKAVASWAPDGLVDTDGHRHAVDAVVLTTGFEATDYLSTVRIVGRTGHSLQEAWAGDPHAFLGIMVPGFPNFFMLYGPNTNGGFIVSNLERQANFAVRELKRLRRTGERRLEVTPEACGRYNAWLAGRMAGTAFGEGRNYFKSASGRIVTQWPDNATQYALKLRLAQLAGGWRTTS